MADKYNEYTKAELLRLLRERDRKPRFGLVWERDEIDHDRTVHSDFVAIDHDATLSSGSAPFRNLLIEGDNFDALRYLRMTHAGKVKCIYIDPPYNTGNKDFIYNDHFLDKDDVYKHSKWLEYMYRRLVLSRDLLREDGVIFVSIGEDEQAHLTLLMDDVFAGMKIGTFIWRRRSGANDAKGAFLSTDHEYVLCYGGPKFSFAGMEKTDKGSNPDGDHRGDWIDGPLNQGKDFKKRTEAFYPLYNPVSDTWYACDPDSVWRFSSEKRLKPEQKIRSKTMEDLVREKRVKWPSDEKVVVYDSVSQIEQAIKDGTAPRNLRFYADIDILKAQVAAGEAPARLLEVIEPVENWVGRKIGFGKPRYKRFVEEIKRSEKPLSTWILPASMKKAEIAALDKEGIETMTTGYTSEGTTLLAQMIGNKDFPYPKPLSLLTNLLNQATEPDDLILDFFAGSGTTAHAVLAINAAEEDEGGGNRRFIMVSSTEASEAEPDKNVCREVTRKRLKAAIEGYSYKTKDGTKTVEGLGGDFAYFRTRRIPTEHVFQKIQHEQVWTALQLIHTDSLSVYDPKARVQVTETVQSMVLYAPKVTEAVLSDILKAVEHKVEAIVYSWQPAVLRQRIEDARVTFEQIPQCLVDRFGAGVKK